MSRRARTSAAPAEPLYGRGGDGLALQFLVLDGFSQKKIFENKLLVAGREWSAANAARYVAVRGFQTSFGLDDLIKRTAIWTGEISRRFGHNSDAPNSLSHAYQYQERPLSSILACKLPVLRFAQQPRQLRLDDLTVTKFEVFSAGRGLPIWWPTTGGSGEHVQASCLPIDQRALIWGRTYSV